ncbi:hypothetical protein [Pseudoalteromonas umbrosa]|uniref:hypothetical protein n=1 Tax=Pseudoalteromonas umbrosa TaxID=3048489 RepID=UPI0024C41DCA|nr:hypothetical protein [Pseudoalteromonas sp. B95]MDK1288510.1 hypothetical protein [Pseudoalteromonas sp. B95]
MRDKKLNILTRKVHSKVFGGSVGGGGGNEPFKPKKLTKDSLFKVSGGNGSGNNPIVYPKVAAFPDDFDVKATKP